MRFSLNIESGNAAMTDEDAPEALADILRDVARKVREGHVSGHAMDYNGNTVGHWTYQREDDEA